MRKCAATSIVASSIRRSRSRRVPAAARRARSLRETMGGANVFVNPKVTVSEDFSAYQKVIPGFFFFLGVVPKDTPPEKVFPNHSPRFWIDEAVLKIGVKALANLTLDYLSRK